MVYVRERTIINLSYQPGHKWAGLNVRAGSLSTGVIIDFSKLRDIEGKKSEELTDEERAFAETMFKMFGEALISWDLMNEAKQEGGEPTPVPPTYEGVRSQDFDFMIELMVDWMNQIMKINPTVGKESASGLQFPEPSIQPPAPPSLNLGNLPMQG